MIRLAGLERLLRGLLQEPISNLGDPKLQRYIKFNIKLLQSEKRCVFFLNICISVVWKISLKEFKAHSEALLLVIDAPKKENGNT